MAKMGWPPTTVEYTVLQDLKYTHCKPSTPI